MTRTSPAPSVQLRWRQPAGSARRWAGAGWAGGWADPRLPPASLAPCFMPACTHSTRPGCLLSAHTPPHSPSPSDHKPGSMAHAGLRECDPGSVAHPHPLPSDHPCLPTRQVESDTMLTQHGFDCLTDWRIVARPPLVIDNQLPVSSQFALWERQQRGGALVLRQQGRLEGGGRARIYSVDMRHQVRAPAAPRPGGPSAPPSPGVPASAVGARLLRPHACRGCCKEAAAQPALKSTLRALCTAPLPPAPRLQVLLTFVPAQPPRPPAAGAADLCTRRLRVGGARASPGQPRLPVGRLGRGGGGGAAAQHLQREGRPDARILPPPFPPGNAILSLAGGGVGPCSVGCGLIC